MSDDPLTFSELRKIQKKEQRQEDLTELGDKFILKVSNYLDMKKETAGDSREYKNARRVFDKIISLREEKIVRNARIAVKSGLTPSDLNLLPSEQELYRELEQVMEDHRKRTGSMVEEDPDQTASEIKSTEEKLEAEPDTLSSEPDVPAKEPEEETGNAEIEEKPVETEPVNDESEPAEKEQEDEIDEEKEGYILVKITSDVPEFMGTDLNTYGPFDEGEEVQIPEDNAEILVNRGNAEEI